MFEKIFVENQKDLTQQTHFHTKVIMMNQESKLMYKRKKTSRRTHMVPLRDTTALSSSASSSPGTLRARSRNLGLPGTWKPVAADSNENTASSSQARRSDENSNRGTGKSVGVVSHLNTETRCDWKIQRTVLSL